MFIPVTDQISLSEWRGSDRVACVERIGDRAIYDRTLQIPHPYTAAHFDQWLATVAEATKQYGAPVHFVIREKNAAIGGISFTELLKGHKTEIGYWLAQPWWSRGIMTAVVGRACEYGFSHWELTRITACVFESNVASARVLEKNGFEYEGLLRHYYLKDGRFLDGRLFALVR